MNRTTFLSVYFLGIVAIFVFGNPWSRVNTLLLQSDKAGQAITGTFWIAMAVPIALIGVAAARGTLISRPRLYLMPLIAFFLSAAAFIYGWLSRFIAGGEPPPSGFLPMSVAVPIGLVAAFGPFIFHVACCVIGATREHHELNDDVRRG